MMISPESFYEIFLQGKTAEEILSAIRGLKQKIGRLKSTLEHPYYECMICPGEDVQLAMSLLYLDRAKQALAEAGGAYIPSKQDLRNKEFNDNLQHLRTLTIEFGQCIGDRKVITIDNHGDSFTIQTYTLLSAEQTSNTFEIKDKHLIIESLQALNMGTWRRKYDTYRYGVAVIDGYSWEVKISFSNGKKSIRFAGNNAYPYNFNDLCGMFRSFPIEINI